MHPATHYIDRAHRFTARAEQYTDSTPLLALRLTVAAARNFLRGGDELAALEAYDRAVFLQCAMRQDIEHELAVAPRSVQEDAGRWPERWDWPDCISDADVIAHGRLSALHRPAPPTDWTQDDFGIPFGREVA